MTALNKATKSLPGARIDLKDARWAKNGVTSAREAKRVARRSRRRADRVEATIGW